MFGILLSLTGRSTFHGQTGTGFVFCVPKCVDFSHFNITLFGAMFIIFLWWHPPLFLFSLRSPKVNHKLVRNGKKSCSFHASFSSSFLSFSSFYRILKGFFSAEGRGDPNHLPGGISCFFPYDFAKVFKKRFPLPIPPSLPSS